MVILYKTSRRIRTLADSRMSWSRTILALRLQCLEPKEGKKATIQFISLVFRQTHQETNCLSPRTTPSLQIVAVSWWVDLCLNLTVLLRLAQKIISHSKCLRQAAGTIWTFQNFQQISTGSVWEWQQTQRLPTIYIEPHLQPSGICTSSRDSRSLPFPPMAEALHAIATWRPKARAAEMDDDMKDVKPKAALWLHWNPPDLSTCCSISLISKQNRGLGWVTCKKPLLESMDSTTREDSKRNFYPVFFGSAVATWAL